MKCPDINQEWGQGLMEGVIKQWREEPVGVGCKIADGNRGIQTRKQPVQAPGLGVWYILETEREDQASSSVSERNQLKTMLGARGCTGVRPSKGSQAVYSDEIATY